MKNKKVLMVTGASSDVGMGLIRKIQSNYTHIIAHYNRSKDRVQALEHELEGRVVPMQCDFADKDAVDALAQQIIDLDIVPTHFVHMPNSPLNNAKFNKMQWHDFEDEMYTSFRSAVILLQSFVPAMVKQKNGKVVFMLSYCLVNTPQIKFAVQYTCAKYALLGLMRGLSTEYAHKGITVNGVSPSMIETRYLKDVHALIVQKNAAESPLKRNLYVDDVIGAFEFFLSEGANCITGQNIAVTGGK
ncbi:MAG: SDR family oxidoreductase [Defluviitaleaceae bacterium]|nr:SDR family oxidoreductase [Defluviitaleaceae bacterium]MCL2238359.1 SDR family oxidoreductase [Defluviitaleaceae bacterium]